MPLALVLEDMSSSYCAPIGISCRCMRDTDSLLLAETLADVPPMAHITGSTCAFCFKDKLPGMTAKEFEVLHEFEGPDMVQQAKDFVETFNGIPVVGQ